jgi:C4-dicarboxylate transporter, DctM subunit
MELLMTGVLALVVLIILLFLSIPIGFCFGLVGFGGLVWVVGFESALATLKTVAYYQVSNYTWAVFPLFILMGEIAGEGQLTADAYNAAKKWVGHIKGGLAFATTVAGTLFAAVCGSQLAASVTMTKVAWPEMKKYGYDPALSLGSILCAGSVATLIPPSIPFVVYGMLVNESVGKLFIGGVIPGFVMSITIMLTVWIWMIIDPKVAPQSPAEPWSERLRAVKGVWSVLALIVLIMGGLWGGVFTANEAAGVGAAGAMVICALKRKLTWQGTKRMFIASCTMAANIFFLLVCVQVFNQLLAVTNVTMSLAHWVAGLHMSAMMILLFVLAIYAILGIPLEPGPLMLLTLPIFVPLLSSLGIDKVWFGILSTITSNLAGLTPPVGMPLFLVHGIVKKDGVSLNTVFKGAWIFCIPILFTLAVCIMFPQLTLWLPSTMFGK